MAFEVPKSFYYIAGGVSIALAIFLGRIAGAHRENPEALRQGVAITLIDSSWSERSSKPGKVALVPTLTFKIRNTREAPLEYVQVNAVFSFVGSKDSFGDAFAYPIQGKQLKTGEQTDAIRVKSNHGYQATSRKSFVNNPDFKPAEVSVFVQSRLSGWVLVGKFPISSKIDGMPQQLILPLKARLSS